MNVSVALATLHDALLVGIELDDDRAKIKCRLAEGSIRTIFLSGIDRLFCNKFLEGNTIFSAKLIACKDITYEHAEHFVARHEILSDRAEYFARIKKSGKSMLLIDSSYGAELGCVCADVVIE